MWMEVRDLGADENKYNALYTHTHEIVKNKLNQKKGKIMEHI